MVNNKDVPSTVLKRRARRAGIFLRIAHVFHAPSRPKINQGVPASKDLLPKVHRKGMGNKYDLGPPCFELLRQGKAPHEVAGANLAGSVDSEGGSHQTQFSRLNPP